MPSPGTWHRDERRVASLERYIGALLGEAAQIFAIDEFGAGASNPTFRLDLGDKFLVLRSKPVGQLSRGAHAIDREFRVLNALKSTQFPVPRPLAYCADHEVIGAHFYLMEYVLGRAFDDYSLPGCSPEERGQIYDSLNASIAMLHSLDLQDLGLHDYGRQDNYFERQIALWERQHLQLGLGNRAFERLASRLKPLVLDDPRRSLLHGDLTFLNCLVDPASPRVAAVLDWELSTTGHPLADFGYHLLHWYLPSSAEIGFSTLRDKNLPTLGIPSMEEYVALYAARTGIPVNEADLNFAIAFNLFRMAGIGMGAVARAQTGTAKNSRAAACGVIVDPLIALADEYLP